VLSGHPPTTAKPARRVAPARGSAAALADVAGSPVTAMGPFPHLRVGPQEISVAATSRGRAADTVVAHASAGHAVAVHPINAYSIVCAHERPEVATALDGDLCFMDGVPLVWLAKAHGARDATRVYGPDLMLDVLDRSRGSGLRHYLYGGTPEVLTLLRQRLTQQFPGLIIAGASAPPFRALTAAEVADEQARIRRCGADVVWIGVGTPEQNVIAHAWAPACQVTTVAVGAAFDFLSGTKRQAPRLLQRLGLEWLFRLCSEPRRLARRYVVGNMRFLRLVAGHCVLIRPGPAPDPSWTS
jgi:N-acetylglucosaminyldiphosphoundecaprenol N-acetyl-beta-D-mannosaminyltransferase